ncbi:MAG: DUF6537 domain-containing protein [Rubrivivax sp.]
MSLAKLMSYKDEYEVARLFTDGSFARQSGRAVRRRPQARVPHGAAVHRAAGAERRAAEEGAPRGLVVLPAMKVLARARCAARR